MRKNTYLLLCAAVISLIASCKQQPEKVVVELPALRASSIYRGDSVYVYMKNYGGKHKEAAAAYYKKGTGLESSDPRKAMYYIKRAITLDPTLEAYKELGALLSKASMYSEAYRLYSFLSNEAYIKEGENNYVQKYLFGKPDEALFHEYMITSILSSNYLDGYPVYQAREAGLAIQKLKNALLADERFKADTGSVAYKNLLLTFMSEEEIEAFRRSSTNFNNFLSSFKDTVPVFNIDEKQVQRFMYDDFNGKNYEGEEGYTISDFYMYFLKEMQGKKNGWYTFNCNHIIRLNDNVTAVVYAIDTSATACPIDMRHIYHHLVTYNPRGEVIDSKVIAWQAGEELGTAQFNRNTCLVTEYKRTWKKPYNMNDFDNDLVKVEEKGVKAYRITDTGMIEQEELLPRE